MHFLFRRGKKFGPNILNPGGSVMRGSRTLATAVNKRLNVAGSLTATPTLVRRLRDFRVKPVPVGSDFEHWREGQYDGLVFSVAPALWAASEGQSIGPVSGEIAALFKWW